MRLVELTVENLDEFRNKVNTLQLANKAVNVININKKNISSDETGGIDKTVYEIFYWEIPIISQMALT